MVKFSIRRSGLSPYPLDRGSKALFSELAAKGAHGASAEAVLGRKSTQAGEVLGCISGI